VKYQQLEEGHKKKRINFLKTTTLGRLKKEEVHYEIPTT
jgi:hypothetical protein